MTQTEMTAAMTRHDELSAATTRRTDMSREPGRSAVNVSTTERVLAGLAGAGLIIYGLGRSNVLVGLGLAAAGGALLYRSKTGYCPLYNKMGMNTARQGSATATDYFEQGVHVQCAYLVARPAADLYTFWRAFENLPRFMKHLDRVEALSDTRSRWTAKGPMGQKFTWVAEIIHDQPNELIAWRSMPGADVDNAGTVRFIERGDETEVSVTLDYIPPAGAVGKVIAQLFGKEPHQTIDEDLRRFKQLHEAGELTRAK